MTAMPAAEQRNRRGRDQPVPCHPEPRRHAHSLDNHIRKLVDRAPELTAEQRDKLALLLRAPASDSAA